MHFRIQLFILIASIFGTTLQAQELNELKAMKAEKQSQINALQKELNNINAQIEAIPKGWEYGGVGILGLNFSGNEKWYAVENPFSSSTSFGVSIGAFANLDAEKYFWNNVLNVNLQKVTTRIQDGEDGPEEEVENITDALDLSSTFGYKLSPKWAISAEGKFVTGVLNFVDPGKLVASAGATWLPVNNLVVSIHPVGYEVNWPGELVSAAGAKVGAIYSRKLLPNVSWSSNLSAFFPYSGGDAEFTNNNDEVVMVEYEAADIIDWTWVNSFSTTLWKNLGVGLNVGLRQDRQLADLYQYDFNGEASDNPLQLYYNLGLSYTF